jgi:uncharacterized membrane protein YdbT with pleckstrin-like domain
MDLSIFKISKYTFDGKKSYENVSILVYRHWITIALSMIGLLLALFLPLALYYIAKSFFANYYNIESIFWFCYLIYMLLWWFALFYNLTMYFLDTWIVSDHRIIDSKQHGFFKRKVSELNLAKIQDISVEIKGLIPTFLDYGNLEIQTAGTEPKFVFEQIPHPSRVKDIIMREHNKYVEAHKGDIEVHELSKPI